jgi:hypothetical protein
MLRRQAIELAQGQLQAPALCLAHGMVFERRRAPEPADFRPKLRITNWRGSPILPGRVRPIQTDGATAWAEPAIIELMSHEQAHQRYRARDIRRFEVDSR